jgi:hypothetical protein
MRRRQFERDRAILIAFEAGRTLKQLAEDYELKVDRVNTIMIAERHRRVISPEPFYRGLRRAQPSTSASF